MVLASVVLPQPDSPASATISPGRICRSTPSTARATFPFIARPENRTSRPSTCRTGVTAPTELTGPAGVAGLGSAPAGVAGLGSAPAGVGSALTGGSAPARLGSAPARLGSAPAGVGSELAGGSALTGSPDTDP